MSTPPVPHLILSSGSPRRVALLQQLRLPFEQIASPEEESTLRDNTPREHVVETASAKARAVHKLVQERRPERPSIIIAADTIVCLGDAILGKPTDAEEAFCMLRRLSGHVHQVYTGLALICADSREIQDCAMTRVWMRRLSEADISGYVRSEEPLDKAGAYGIQGLGARFIERIEGCYYNVVGLPLSRLNILLEKAGYNFSTTTGRDL